MLILIEFELQIILACLQLRFLHHKFRLFINQSSLSISDYQLVTLMICVKVIPIAFAQTERSCEYLLVKSFYLPKQHNLQVGGKQLQKIQISCGRIGNILVFAFLLLMNFSTNKEQLAVELLILKMVNSQLVQLDELVYIFLHLKVDLALLFNHEYQSIHSWLDQQQRNSPCDEPKRYDLVHAGFIINFDPCVFVSNQQVASFTSLNMLQKGWNAQIRVEIFLFSFSAYRVDISELIRNVKAVAIIGDQTLQLFVELY